jgi:hypothetical protein
MKTVMRPTRPNPTHRVRTRVRRIFRAVGVCMLGLVMVVGLNGAVRKDKAGKSAWFSAKGLMAFPLAKGEYPRTTEELVESMTRGWDRTPVALAPGRQTITAVGTPPVVRSLTVDLSDASINPKVKSAAVSRKAPTERTMTVKQLAVRARSVHVADDATLNMMMTADDARLDLKHDKAGDPLLTLTEMRTGTFEFSTKITDIEAILLAAAKADAGKVGLNVQSVDLDLVAEDDRTIKGALKVRTKFAFIGAGLMFTARVQIDDDMNAKLTDLKCWGDDVLGPVIIGIMRPALDKHNNREKLILSFPDPSMRLRDVRVTVDDAIHVKAEVGKS